MTAAAEVIPRPKAAIGVVFVDAATRSLSVRLSELESGYSRLLWRDGWTMLREAQEAGWPIGGPPWVLAGSDPAIHGQPTEGGALTFTWPIGHPGYAELVAKPGLTAIVTMDIATRHILSCRFLHGPA